MDVRGLRTASPPFHREFSSETCRRASLYQENAVQQSFGQGTATVIFAEPCDGRIHVDRRAEIIVWNLAFDLTHCGGLRPVGRLSQ